MLFHPSPRYSCEWRLLQNEIPEMKEIIQAGLDKLEDYFHRVMYVPAYIFAMSKSLCFCYHSILNISRSLKSKDEATLV